MTTGSKGRGPSVWRRLLHFNNATSEIYRRFVSLEPARPYYTAGLDRYLRDAEVAIHVGAGGKDPATLTTVDLSGKTIYAVDPSPESLERNPNPNKIEAWAHDIPLADASVDLIFSEYLMEHVEDPQATLREAYRLLRPGGHVYWLAPNLWSYSGLITHWTPIWFHLWVTRLLEPVQIRKAAADVFPTWFRVNSIPRVRRLLREAGFELEDLYMVADAPHYTKIAPLIHQLTILLHIMLDRFEFLRAFRINMVVCGRKPVG